MRRRCSISYSGGEDEDEDDMPASLHEAFQPVTAMVDQQRRVCHGVGLNGDGGGGGRTAQGSIHEDGQ